MRKSKNISGKQIAKARKSHNWTQKELVERLRKQGMKIDRAGLAKIENGLRCVFDYELPIIANILKVSVVWMLTRGKVRLS